MSFESPTESAFERHLFVTDLDGTLLDNNSEISPTSQRLISKLIDNGILLTIATARTPATVDVLFSNCPLSLPAIVMTGAALWNCKEKKYSHIHYLPLFYIDYIISIFNEMSVSPFIYTLPINSNILEVYKSQSILNEAEKDFIRQRSNLPLKKFIFVKSINTSTIINSALLILALGNITDIYTIAKILRDNTPLTISCYRDSLNPDIGVLEILAANVSKASAIRSLALDINANKIVVYGDNLNDISMMQVADVSIAVSNAVKEVKDVSTEIIGSNTSDAVPRHIARYNKLIID